MNEIDKKYKNYLDFDIYYRGMLLGNIVEIEEVLGVHGNVCMLDIKYIDGEGDFRRFQVGLNQLKFKPKDMKSGAVKQNIVLY